MGNLQQQPKPSLCLEGRWLALAEPLGIPDAAYPPVLVDGHPFLVIDDIALDLSCDEPCGYSGCWAIEQGRLSLRWLLGRNQVRLDIHADWVTGTLRAMDGDIEVELAVEHGRVVGMPRQARAA